MDEQNSGGKQKEEAIEMEGIVREALKNRFRVEICEAGKEPDPDKPGHEVSATLAGKLRQNSIRIVQGDRVRVELSPYDLKSGRITYRLQKKK